MVLWLDDNKQLAALESGFHCPICGHTTADLVFSYGSPPAGETFFKGISDGPYARKILQCTNCALCVNRHPFDLSRFYEGAYVDGTYGDAERMRAQYDKIMALPPERSDNFHRVKAIETFWGNRPLEKTVLDVGAGLCVFLARMKTTGWSATALDPDPGAARHAREVVGVSAIQGDWMKHNEIGRYNLITFNKVLEHVLDPAAMLKKAAQHLNPGGVVYVELPDAEAAAAGGPQREEFFIEHHFVFSAASAALLSAQAGFVLQELQRVREPSSKYTLRAFLTAA